MDRSSVNIPANVPDERKDTYIDNYLQFTKGTGRGFLFAGDQRIEHLNDDFTGPAVAQEDQDPEHFFRIASQSPIGCFAAQHGMISRYARDYPQVPYLVKMNSRTRLVPGEPVSTAHIDFEDVLSLRDNGVNVIGVGYTLYIGSKHEAIMLEEAGRIAARAHEEGLIVIFWMYPRGAAVPQPKDPQLAAGVAGVGVSLGADFVKITKPVVGDNASADLLKDAVKAGGRTGILVSGGAAEEPGAFLHEVFEHVQVGCAGAAVGRNVHQRPLDEAVRFCRALSAVIYEGKSTHDAWLIYSGE